MGAPGEPPEGRLKRVEYAIWGLQGNNGMVSDLRGLRREFQQFAAAEAGRREGDVREKARTSRLVALSAMAAVVSLIGVIAMLVVVLVVGPS